MASSVMLALTLAHLLITFACGQMNYTSPETCPVTQTQQLTVNGCPVFVHDVSGTKDFVVEPLMCITSKLTNLPFQSDPLTNKIFMGVPVTLRDDTMLAKIKNQLQHLSPNSVKFASVSDISVSTDASSNCLQALWSPDKEVGYLRLSCLCDLTNCGSFFVSLKDSIFDVINGITATAEIELGSVLTKLKYKFMVQNQTFFYPVFYGSKFEYESNCDNLQFIRSINVGKCVAQVYQRQGVKNIFYIEPLLCPSDKVTNYTIIYDYSRDMYFLKLDVLLQDDVTLNEVRSKLAHLSPANVSFLQLWRVEIAVSSILRSRFEMGPLMVSGDWRSGQVRVYCKIEDDCKHLRSNMIANPLGFWIHVNCELTSHIPNQCIVKSGRSFYNIRIAEASGIGKFVNSSELLKIPFKSLPTKSVNGNLFVIIQQRMSNSVSFERTWNEYEAGFGDAQNFWIGLSTIHLLSINGVTFRMEMKLKNGSEHHQEYANFKVGDASTNYAMTCGGIIKSRSSDGFDAMQHTSGVQFTTLDRDNDHRSGGGSCSTYHDNSGWWFRDCAHSLPNTYYGGVMWCLTTEWVSPKEIRLMLQI